MPWALLDDSYHSNKKIELAGIPAAGIYSLALAYCAHYFTDGFVPRWWAEGRAGRYKRHLKTLTDVGLWQETEPGDTLEMTDRSSNIVTISVRERGFFIPDFVRYNFSSIEARTRKKDKSEAGKKGAIRRWGTKPDNSSHSTGHDTSHSSTQWQNDGTTRVHAPPASTSTSKDLKAEQYSVRSGAALPLAKDFNPLTDEADRSDPIIRLLLALKDRDEQTEHVLRSFTGRVPEAAFDFTRDELERTGGGAGKAVTILKRIEREGTLATPGHNLDFESDEEAGTAGTDRPAQNASGKGSAYVAGLIRNGVITERHELETELSDADVPAGDRAALVAQFERQAVVEVVE